MRFASHLMRHAIIRWGNPDDDGFSGGGPDGFGNEGSPVAASSGLRDVPLTGTSMLWLRAPYFCECAHTGRQCPLPYWPRRCHV